MLGGAGFIGRWLARALLAEGYAVTVVDPREPEPGLEWVRGDAREFAAVAKAVRPGDWVVHLFHSSVPEESMADPAAELTENVIPYVHLLERLADLGAGLIAYSSTGGQIYGEAPIPTRETFQERPLSAYGAAKLAMEQFTRLATRRRGLPHLIFRVANPYGPHQELTNRHGVIPALFQCVRDRRPFRAYGGGATVRDYIYIEDAAAAIAALLEPARNLTVNVGTGLGVSLTNLIREVEAVTGAKIQTVPEPIRPSDVMNSVLDPTRLFELTKFAAEIPLAEGLRRTWDHLRKNEKA